MDSQSDTAIAVTLNVRQYVNLKDQIDMLTDRRDEVKKRLLSDIDAHGETNSKGHVVLVVDDVDGVSAVVKQRRVSKVFNPDKAEALLRERGLYDSCVKTIEVLDSDAVMAAYYRDELTDADVDAMFPEKVTSALVLEK